MLPALKYMVHFRKAAQPRCLRASFAEQALVGIRRRIIRAVFDAPLPVCAQWLPARVANQALVEFCTWIIGAFLK